MPALLRKKNKSKKKKAVMAVPGVAFGPAPSGAPEQTAPEIPSRVGRQQTRDKTMCINYGCAGHFRLECVAPPRCPTTLAYLGYGTEGGGSFYYVDAEIEEEAVWSHLATVTLAPEQVLPQGVVIPADLIQAKLAAYIGNFRGSDFAWEVTEMAPLVFSVPFPSAELLRVFSHDFIRCPMNQFQISVHAAATEPDPVSPLDKVWVLVYGFPRGGRSAPRGVKLAHILKAISEPVGKLVTADLVSFEDDGPARIEILCPAPSKIDGLSLRFYFGTKGRRLTFELESPVPEERLRPAPSASVPRDEGQDGDGGSCGESSFCEEDDGDVGVPSARYDGRHSPGSTGGGSSGQAGLTSQVASGVVDVVMAGPPPVATTAADLEIVEADFLSVGMEGILLGVREDAFSVEDMDRGEFFMSMSVTDRRVHLSSEVIIVYGPTDHRCSADFLAELKNKVERRTTLVVVAGDFNLIRWASDKSSPNMDRDRMRLFNDCIADPGTP
ncbi:putative anion transporter 2, chloroplastic [Hordeum vulgare]|nr:putative anion transporter 2, chloroplastic [Hordeum vulgare]